jgi:hypothetical protein
LITQGNVMQADTTIAAKAIAARPMRIFSYGGSVTVALCHLVSSYQQFMRGTGAGNVARLCVCLLHSDGHIPSREIPTMAPLGDSR